MSLLPLFILQGIYYSTRPSRREEPIYVDDFECPYPAEYSCSDCPLREECMCDKYED